MSVADYAAQIEMSSATSVSIFTLRRHTVKAIGIYQEDMHMSKT